MARREDSGNALRGLETELGKHIYECVGVHKDRLGRAKVSGGDGDS